jgi:hypothetical protein
VRGAVCDVPPVVGKTVIEGYAMLVVAYLQDAFSLVVTDSEVLVVPAGRVPLGEGLVITGGVTSGGATCGVTLIVTLWLMEPPAPVQTSV